MILPQKKTLFLLFFVASFLSCTPPLPRCRSTKECLKGFVCAETQQSSLHVCVKIPSSPSLLRQRPPTPLSTSPSKPKQQRRLASLAQTECTPLPYKEEKDPGNGGKKVQLDPQDKELFAQLRKLYHISERCSSKIWGSGFRIDRIPSYFVNVGSARQDSQQGIRGFLLNHPNPPPEAILIDSRQTHGLMGVYLYNTQKDQISPPGFLFNLKINEISSYAMTYGNQKRSLPYSKGFLRLYVHEIFHRAQDIEEAWKAAQGNQNRRGYALDSQSMALAMLENRLLARGLEASNPKEFLLLFYAVRNHRILRNPDRKSMIEDYDNYQEWLEGTAMFVEHNFSRLAGIPFLDEEINNIPNRLLILEKHPKELDRSFIREVFFSRFYATGAAIGLLLDRVGDTTWRLSCREGRTLYQHLQGYFGRLSAKKRQKLLQQAHQSHHFAALLRLSRTFVRKLRQK